MEIYLDNSATTRCTPQVISAVVQAMETDYGNPSSQHMKGVEAERILRDAREKIAATLKCKDSEVFFTSGGTESDNWALIGAAMANRRAGNHLITTSIEHEAILQTMQYLEGQGFRVTYLPVDRYGFISLKELEEAICEDTILVSIMAINNEVGAVEPIAEAAALVKKIRPSILFHTDAVQAYGRIPLYPGRMNIDMISASGHKIHGPKGTGFLYIKEKTRIRPYILGGGQQKGMRSGTDNVPGAAGLARAAVDCCKEMKQLEEHCRKLKTRLIDGLTSMERVVIHSKNDETGAAHIVNAAFIGVRSEVLLHTLEDKGIYVSSGSACSSNRQLPVSPVLEQLGLPREELESSLRFSFSRFTTEEEIDLTVEALRECLPMLRRYSRR